MVAAGVGLWAVGLVLLYALQAAGAAAVPAWGIWTALGGTVLGSYGAYLLWRRDRRLRRGRPG